MRKSNTKSNAARKLEPLPPQSNVIPFPGNEHVDPIWNRNLQVLTAAIDDLDRLLTKIESHGTTHFDLIYDGQVIWTIKKVA